MNLLCAGAIASFICLPLLPVWPTSLTPEEKQAFDYIRTQRARKNMCVSAQRQQVPSLVFQEQLFKLDRKYTLAYLDSVDQQLAGPTSGSQDVFPRVTNRRQCAFEVVFPRKALANFLLCEVFPAGDRTFTVTEVYLFEVKDHRVRFVSKVELNYN